ncbi:MAG TPA: hypothetical protein PK971_04305, partial [Saprospiraceae bacterium]|nr:hypothetical protein [Saprospiraceae bacterium]
MAEATSPRARARSSKALAALTGLLLLARASAQTTATAALNRPVVEAGDTFSMRVLVAGMQSEPRRVDFSAWYAAGFAPENVLSRSAWSRSGARWVQQFTLICFDSAALRLPPLYVHTHLGDSLPNNPL